MFKIFVVALLALGLSLRPAAAAAPTPAPQSVDVTKFDVSGVRLYMTGAEALAALRDKLGKGVEVAYQQINARSGNFKGDYIEVRYGKSLLNPDAKFIDLISFRSGAYRGYVELSDRVEQDGRGPEAVVDVHLEILSRNQPDLDNFEKAIVEKYGPPPLRNIILGWCSEYKEAFGYHCDMDHARYLVMGQAYIDLHDPVYNVKVREIVAKRQPLAGKAPL